MYVTVEVLTHEICALTVWVLIELVNVITNQEESARLINMYHIFILVCFLFLVDLFLVLFTA